MIFTWQKINSSKYNLKKMIMKITFLELLPHPRGLILITHWGRMTYICTSKLTITGSESGLSPGWRQAIIWTNARICLIRNLGTHFSEILSKIHAFSLTKMHLKISSGKWRPFCLGLNVLSRGEWITDIATTPGYSNITMLSLFQISEASKTPWILRENHHASVVWNWYHWVSIAYICKIAIATKWYRFHTTDKCGFLFMPWITDQYTFVQYTKLVNN